MTAPTPWATAADAIQAAIVAASGLTAAAVRWRYQDAAQPALPYVDLSLGVATELGEPYVCDDYDATRDPGKEVKLEVRGLQEISLTVEVFSATTTPDDGAAIALAHQIRQGLRLPSVRDALQAVGFVPLDSAGVQWLPEIVAAGFRGRATFDTRCTLPAPTVAEYAGYIATIAGTVTAKQGGVAQVARAFSAVIG